MKNRNQGNMKGECQQPCMNSSCIHSITKISKATKQVHNKSGVQKKRHKHISIDQTQKQRSQSRVKNKSNQYQEENRNDIKSRSQSKNLRQEQILSDSKQKGLKNQFNSSKEPRFRKKSKQQHSMTVIMPVDISEMRKSGGSFKARFANTSNSKGRRIRVVSQESKDRSDTFSNKENRQFQKHKKHHDMQMSISDDGREPKFINSPKISSSHADRKLNIIKIPEAQFQTSQFKDTKLSEESTSVSQKQIISKLQKQLREQEDAQITFNATTQQNAEKVMHKARKYKIIAKEYRAEIDLLKEQLENERSQWIDKEQSRNKAEEDLTNQRNRIINEIWINVQKTQNLAIELDEQHEILQYIAEIQTLLKAYSHIGQYDENSHEQQSLLEFLRDQAAVSYRNTDEKFQGSVTNSQRFNVIQKHHQQSSDSHSIFSPQFMISSHRQVPVQSNTNQNNNDSSAIENFTLTWDQSSSAQGAQAMATAGQTQTSNLSNDQRHQYDLLMKIQGEMMQLRDDSIRIIEENNKLKEQNQQLTNELRNSFNPHHQKNDLSKSYSIVFEQLRQSNAHMQQRIDELEESKNCSDLSFTIRLQQQINEMKEQMKKYEKENLNLKEEREVQKQKIQNLESSNKTQGKMIHALQTTILSQNWAPSSHEDSIQHYAEAKKSEQQQKSLSTSGEGRNNTQQRNHSADRLNEEGNLYQPFILTNTSAEQRNYEPQISLNNRRESSDSNLSRSLNHSRSLKGQNRSIQNGPNDSNVYMDTGVNKEKSDINYGDDKDNLFSLSSTMPENHMKNATPNLKNVIPKSLDFNHFQNMQIHYQFSNDQQTNAYQQELPPINKSLYNTTKSSQFIKVDASRKSLEETLRERSVEQSSTELSNTNPLFNGGATEPNLTQESEDFKRPILPNKNQQYQKMKFKESDHSYQKNRINTYDSKNATQKIPMILQENTEGTQINDTYQHLLSHQPSREQLFSKATTNKNSSRKALTAPLNPNMSADNFEQCQSHSLILPCIDGGNPKSPAFLSQNFSERDNNVKINYDHFMAAPQCNTQDHVSGKNLNDFKLIMFNNTTGSNTQQSVLSASQVNVNLNGTSESNIQFGNGGNIVNSMSLRTFNLKKEICSLDQEILMLQNSLKQALSRKTTANV